MTLTRTLKLSDGDLDLSTGNLVVMSGEDSWPQRIEVAWSTFKGEVFTDESKGVPYFQQIFGSKNPRVSVLNGGFIPALEDLDGYVKVQRLEYNLVGESRDLEISGVIEGEGGAIARTVVTV